mmetsp:Transcript_41280/g.106805  ORF Transcript_41280/g.106805 Transcript_41280/m.106805 type:complete len:191 (+) Transcript_41280:248-820(+)
MATLPPLPSEFGVSIVATDVEKTKTGHPFTIYVMKINRKWKRNVTDREVWTARRRYREFRSLRKKLLRDYPSLKEVPFPGKKYFSRMADAVVEDRRWKLERFLSRVLSLPFPKEGNGLLNRFLGAEDDNVRDIRHKIRDLEEEIDEELTLHAEALTTFHMEQLRERSLRDDIANVVSILLHRLLERTIGV